MDYVQLPGKKLSAQLLAGGEKLWFLDIWKRETCTDVWRVEFQLRRELLKQFNVDTIDELVTQSGGMWRYLTDEWLSFRVHDNNNATRRTPHLWWSTVQEIGSDFGSQIQIKREYSKGGRAPVEWY